MQQHELHERAAALTGRGGFTLIELLVVVLIIGILAAVAVPQYFRVVEKGRMSHGLSYVQGLKGAEERALAKTGNYVSDGALDVTQPAPIHVFYPSAITPNGSTDWRVALTRIDPVPVYGVYVVTFNSVSGFSCNNASCTNELLP